MVNLINLLWSTASSRICISEVGIFCVIIRMEYHGNWGLHYGKNRARRKSACCLSYQHYNKFFSEWAIKKKSVRTLKCENSFKFKTTTTKPDSSTVFTLMRVKTIVKWLLYSIIWWMHHFFTPLAAKIVDTNGKIASQIVNLPKKPRYNS